MRGSGIRVIGTLTAVAALAAPVAQAQWSQTSQLVGQGFNSKLGERVAVEWPVLYALGVSDQEPFALDFMTVFEADAGVWEFVEFPADSEQLYLPPRADISNGTLVVTTETGARGLGAGIPAPRAGVYEKIAGAWIRVQELEGPERPDGLSFNTRDLAVSGDTIMLLTQSTLPSVDVFRRSSDAFNWSFEARIDLPLGFPIREVDISGDIAVAGPVVLRDGPTGWTIETTLVASDGAQLGWASGVFEQTIVVTDQTAPDSRGDANAGAAYVFEETSPGMWEETAILTASRPQTQAYFGRSVAIDDDTIVVGESNRTRNGKDRAGAAYVFQQRLGVWEQAAELLPGDGAGERYYYGWDVDISGGVVAIGAWGWGTIPNPDYPEVGTQYIDGPGAVYIYGCDLDTDGDGLCDDWEINGVPYVDQFGDPQRYLLDVDGDGVSDANPLRKDLFVEVDVMDGVPFIPEAIDDVIAAFANAPVTNAEPSTGITLHVQIDETNLPFDLTWSDDFSEFDASKDLHFGTTVEQGSPEVLDAKAKAYRYSAWVNAFAPSNAMGWGELRGNDFTVAFGGLPEDKQTRSIMASTWMHELGHNLNLKHGGADDVNYKPNHVSVMNYAFDDYLKIEGENFVTVPVDFSREQTPALLETSLDETAGVSSAEYANIITFFTTDDPMAPSRSMQLDGRPTDFDASGEIDTDPVIADLNNVDGSSDPFDALIVENEWDLIILGLGGDGDYLDRQHTTLPPSEIDVATVELLDQLAEAAFNDCPTDLNADGVTDGADLGLLLGAWGGAGGDLNGDGVTDGADLGLLLGAWGACP